MIDKLMRVTVHCQEAAQLMAMNNHTTVEELLENKHTATEKPWKQCLIWGLC
jgi:hypothetical protein